MNTSELDFKAVYEYDSPVEFVLISTIGKVRAVVAKSAGARIDLAAYAWLGTGESEYQHPSPLMQIFFPALEQLAPLVGNSAPVENPRSFDYDDRFSEFTLVWRGVDQRGIRDRVNHMLDGLAPSLTSALNEASKAEMEWLLSPIIARCNDVIVRARNRRFAKSTFARFVAAVLFSYTFVGAAAYFLLDVVRR